MSSKNRTKRHVNRMADDRLWDDVGDEWQLEERGLSQKRAEQLFNTPGIRIGIHEDYGQPIQWLSGPAKETFLARACYARLQKRSGDRLRTEEIQAPEPV